ncbi:MAG: tetratricopeptide repeat protein [Vampirovibrionales bacterium]
MAFTANPVEKIPFGFHGRQPEFDLLDEQCEKATTPQQWRTLSIHGAGGAGKTNLSYKYAERLKEKNIPHAHITLEETSRSVDVLKSIRLQLGRNYALSTPCFDLAYLKYMQLEHPDYASPRLLKEHFKGDNSEFLQDLTEFCEGPASEVVKAYDADIAGLVTSVFIPGSDLVVKVGLKAIQKIRRHFSEKQVDALTKMDCGFPRLNDLETGVRILENLHYYLAKDLASIAMESEAPIVLIFDHYEALFKRYPENHNSDQWLREFRHTMESGLFIALGRSPLRWQKVDKNWKDHITDYHLGELDPDAREALLDDAQVIEAEIRERILNVAKGLPFYIVTQCEMYQNIKTEGNVPQLDQFGKTQEETLHYFMEDLNATDQHMFRLVSYPRQLNQAIFTVLDTSLDFERLALFSAFTQVKQGEWMMHDLFREHLQDRDRTKESRVVFYIEQQQKLFDYHDAHAVPDSANLGYHLVEAAYHLMCGALASKLDIELVVDWINEKHIALSHHAIFDGLLEAYAQLEPLVHQLPDTHPSRSNLFMFKGAVFEGLGRYEEALEAYETAERGYSILPDTHPHRGTLFMNKGNVFEGLRRYEEALEAYEAAEMGYSTLPDTHPSRGGLFVNKGIALQHLSRYEEALEAYETAEMGLNTLPETHPHRGGLFMNKGTVLQGLRRYEEALEAYEAAEMGYSTLPDTHPSLGGIFNNKGNVLMGLERYEEALEAYEAAETGYSTVPETHPLRILNLVLRAEALIHLNRKKEASLILQEARRRSLQAENQPYLEYIENLFGLL